MVVIHSKRKRRKALFTTVPAPSVSLVNQVKNRIINVSNLETVDDCLLAANNESFQSGKVQPAIGLHFLKENIPSIDILEYPTWEEYHDALNDHYDIVAIGFYTTNYFDACTMAAMAREKGVSEIWAGNYGVFTPGCSTVFDRVVPGYPERELKKIIEYGRLEKIKHPVLTTPFRRLSQGEQAGFLITNRGCLFNCGFCSSSYFSREIDTISIEEIDRVIESYASLGIRYIIIFDETFLQKRNHAKQVIEILNKKKMKWFCTTRADLISGNEKELKSQGLDGVYMGIESLRDYNLSSQNKNESVDKVLRTIRELNDADVSVSGTYILGLDNDTKESLLQDLEYLKTLPLFVLIFLVYTPYPELPFYERLKRQNKIIHQNWKLYDGMNLVFDHPNFTPDDMRQIFEVAVTSVYSPYNVNKRRVLQRLDKIRTSGSGKALIYE
jgi:uncharacterized radical SAM superfamily protein